MFRKSTIVTLAVIVLVISTPIALAQTQTVIDDFEDNSMSDWTYSFGDSTLFGTTNSVDIEGDYSAFVGDGSGSTVIAKKDGVSYAGENVSSLGFYFYANGSFPHMEEGQTWIRWGDDFSFGEEVTRLKVRSDGSVEMWQDGIANYDTGYDLPDASKRYFFEFEHYYGNKSFVMKIYDNDGNLLHNEGNKTMYNNGGDRLGAFEIKSQTSDVWYIDYIVINENPVSGGSSGATGTLELEIDSWQAFNSTQDYEVYLNETNTTTGQTTLTEVTADANLTSSESNIVAVNNTTDQLESFGVTGVSEINASYTNDSNTYQSGVTNVTVGNRNLSNIGIMPPGQYINSFLGVDSTDSRHNVGSDTQWLIFIIIVAAAFGNAFDNDWIGLGLGLLTAIMLWVLAFIGLGMVLTITFFVIFVSTLKMRVHRRGGNRGDINVNVESRDFNQ